MLKGKKILLGVCGSIAAYKAALLVRLFVQKGAEVKVIMTPESTNFITPLTLATLSKNPVHSHFIADTDSGVWTNHVALGLWADLFLIAPITANTLAKMANGLCDNLLTATYLSARCPVYVAPAMDLDMWQHPSTQANVGQLKAYGNHVIDVASGELASGLTGKGRMAEPEHIIAQIETSLGANTDFVGQQFLITAGPTQEAIDPVRYLTNHSTGTMGVAIANEAANRGAKVDLILGPTANKFQLEPNVNIVPVGSAAEMYDAVDKRFDQSQVTIMAAAVADYTPAHPADHKIKKTGEDWALQLTRTKDILKNMGARKAPHQILVGFALESQDGIKNAESKLQQKNCDFIVLNSLSDPGAGFKHVTNQVTFIEPNHQRESFALKSKKEVAKDILNKVKAIQDND